MPKLDASKTGPIINARFWISHRGCPVKLTLAPGGSASHSYTELTDDGYLHIGEAFEFDGERLTCDWHSDARDCDGRLTRTGAAWTTPADARAYPDNAGVAWPMWHEEPSSQRDYSAEAMGY